MWQAIDKYRHVKTEYDSRFPKAGHSILLTLEGQLYSNVYTFKVNVWLNSAANRKMSYTIENFISL